MKLMHNPRSPFVRMVMVAAAEKGLASALELVPTAVGQGKNNAELMALNPIGKIPTLVTDDGEALFDSLVIIDYFDTLKPEPRLIPQADKERRRALRLKTAADGLIIAGVLAKTETARPAERQWPEFAQAQMAKVLKCVEFIANELARDPDKLTCGEIAAGCALAWMDARAPEEDWRTHHPGLAKWFATFDARPSMVGSRP